MAKQVKLSWDKIHRAIHDGSEYVMIDGKPIPIKKSTGKNLRFIRYDDSQLGRCTIIEQNPNKIGSEYAARAKTGETLTWVIPDSGKQWELIEFKVEKKEVIHA